MLYLIALNNTIKIGYATNIDDRMRAYKTHNPMAELLAVLEGDKDLEKRFHSIMDSNNNCKKIDNTEWYEIFDNDMLSDIKKEGFNYFLSNADLVSQYNIPSAEKIKKLAEKRRKEKKEMERLEAIEYEKRCLAIIEAVYGMDFIRDKILEAAENGCDYVRFNAEYLYNKTSDFFKSFGFDYFEYSGWKGTHHILTTFFNKFGYKSEEYYGKGAYKHYHDIFI